MAVAMLAAMSAAELANLQLDTAVKEFYERAVATCPHLRLQTQVPGQAGDEQGATDTEQKGEGVVGRGRILARDAHIRITCSERKYWEALKHALDSLREYISSAKWDSVWLFLDEVERVLSKSKWRCDQCWRDMESSVMTPLRALREAWHDHESWPAELRNVKDMLQRHLDGPGRTQTVCLPIEKLLYTQSRSQDTFRHGKHRGQSICEVAELLYQGNLRADQHVEMILDVVRFHGDFWSLNNRHLKACKEFMSKVKPPWLRASLEVQVRIWPLMPGLRLHEKSALDIVDKFCIALSTVDRGRSLSLRSGSSSRNRSSSVGSRRVQFDDSGDD